jgi:hypothetical protein
VCRFLRREVASSTGYRTYGGDEQAVASRLRDEVCEVVVFGESSKQQHKGRVFMD